jgi:hypothetical protein
VLTLRCSHPYHGAACRCVVGWVGTSRGEIAVEWIERRVMGSTAEPFWNDENLVAPLGGLRRDHEDVDADCDRHGSCVFTVDRIEHALKVRAVRVRERDLLSD